MCVGVCMSSVSVPRLCSICIGDMANKCIVNDQMNLEFLNVVFQHWYKFEE